MDKRINVKYKKVKKRDLAIQFKRARRLARVGIILKLLILLILILGWLKFDAKTIRSALGMPMIEDIEQKLLFSNDRFSMHTGHSIMGDSTSPRFTRLSHDSLINANLIVGDSDIIYFNGDTLFGHYGIDVSHHQGEINWAEVENDTAGDPISFYILKATQGRSYVDNKFSTNWSQIKGVPNRMIGAYHFYVSSEDPEEQAQNYIRTVSLVKGNFAPIIDLEYECSTCTSISGTTKTYQENLNVFMDIIEEHFKAKPIIYTFTGFKDQYLGHAFDDYVFWMARYSKNTPPGFELYGNQDSTQKPLLGMWQFSDKEKVQGIKTDVDMSYLPENYVSAMLIQ